MSGISLLSICLSLACPLVGRSPAQDGGAPSMTPINLALYDAQSGQTIQLSFQAESQATGDLRSPGGVWFRGAGTATDRQGKTVVPRVSVDLKLALGTAPERITSIAGARVASFASPAGIDLMRITTVGRADDRMVTVVNFKRQRLAEFHVGADWSASLDEEEIAGLLAQLFGLLTTPGGERDEGEGCDPTFSKAYTTCSEGCQNQGGLCEFHYSCNPQTGEVAVSCKCCQVGGGIP